MLEVTTIGLDIAKNVFHAHGAESAGRAVFSRKLTRGKLLDRAPTQWSVLIVSALLPPSPVSVGGGA
jgi:hypothetical protein